MSDDHDSLFACTKCHKKYPFEKLSGSLMQCKGCQNGGNKILGLSVCTYCREEHPGKEDSLSICAKCQQNVKQYGKPRACEICNIVAAFIGAKCQRCVVSEKKWGSPVTCDQCKQKCAFNRKGENGSKLDSKVLCWLCTIAFKKVLAKARKKENNLLFFSSESHPKRKLEHKRSRAADKVDPNIPKKSKQAISPASNGTSSKRLGNVEESANNFMHDMNIILVTQLREEVEALKKTLAAKEKLLLEKERKITEYKTIQMELEKSHREKVVSLQKQQNESLESLHNKNKDLVKQIATLSKMVKRPVASATNSGSNSGSPAINP